MVFHNKTLWFQIQREPTPPVQTYLVEPPFRLEVTALQVHVVSFSADGS